MTELVSWGLEGEVRAMASQPSTEENLSIRHGFRCVPENGVKVEEVLLAVGEQGGAEFIHSASRMNKAVVVFMKRANLVGKLIASGILGCVGANFTFTSFYPFDKGGSCKFASI